MIHEELLANINAAIKDRNADYGLVKGLYGLRAVVELHKPIEVPHDNYKSSLGCSSPDCIDHYNEPIEYPCSTIQAIQKELM